MLNGLLLMAGTGGGGAAGGSGGGLMGALIPMVVIFAIFYFLMIRPQQKQQKKLREMLGALKKGDNVITRGGIHGNIHGIADNIITLEIAENVMIKINKEFIATVKQ